jgi:hypothetical protein
MSVLVADSNGNPAAGTVVSLSLWPIAWSTGTACTPDGDTATGGTFYNEDINENLILDPGEDGTRTYYPYSGLLPLLAGNVLGGKTDGLMTPPNSAAGTLTSKNPVSSTNPTGDAPGTVTTNAQGVGAFTWTYTKNNAIWIMGRIRATAVVQGSATVAEVVARLVPALADTAPCLLPPSPYLF